MALLCIIGGIVLLAVVEKIMFIALSLTLWGIFSILGYDKKTIVDRLVDWSSASDKMMIKNKTVLINPLSLLGASVSIPVFIWLFGWDVGVKISVIPLICILWLKFTFNKLMWEDTKKLWTLAGAVMIAVWDAATLIFMGYLCYHFLVLMLNQYGAVWEI